MSINKSYLNPPIVEALIDFRVETSSDLTLVTLEDIKDTIYLDYPKCESIFLLEGEIQGGENVKAEASQTPMGYKFSDIDDTYILQTSLDGFTCSRLTPYNGWKTLRDEAKRLWEIYRAVTKPTQIIRIAVRYINRLELPFEENGSLDFKDYLRTIPEISPDMFQGLSNYYMKLEIPQQDINGVLVLQQALLPPSPSRNLASVLLDIDLFCNINLSDFNEEPWKLLEQLRTRKNDVFEACITEKTRRLWDNADNISSEK